MTSLNYPDFFACFQFSTREVEIQSGEYFIVTAKDHPPALWIFFHLFLLDSKFPLKVPHFYNSITTNAVFLQRVCDETSFCGGFGTSFV